MDVMNMPPDHVVTTFVNSINNKNLQYLGQTLTYDHSFILDRECKINGKQEAKDAWECIFNAIPDLNIEVKFSYGSQHRLRLICRIRGALYNPGYPLPIFLPDSPSVCFVCIKNNKISLVRCYGFKAYLKSIQLCSNLLKKRALINSGYL